MKTRDRRLAFSDQVRHAETASLAFGVVSSLGQKPGGVSAAQSMARWNVDDRGMAVAITKGGDNTAPATRSTESSQGIHRCFQVPSLMLVDKRRRA